MPRPVSGIARRYGGRHHSCFVPAYSLAHSYHSRPSLLSIIFSCVCVCVCDGLLSIVSGLYWYARARWPLWGGFDSPAARVCDMCSLCGALRVCDPMSRVLEHHGRA
eukprot:TRINITY_DN7470_c0_g1_i1.p1 TRINITY_DN7470_c0_g1~~TRINITY_DN7470_c0_g1_i1.p1  ORF type:complete len:107 (+),score=2.20 TRINITY_DN7470_c0_g1_i1:18-338(+)